MTNTLVLRIEASSTLEEHGTKEDGTPDIREKSEVKIQLVADQRLILWNETFRRETLPFKPAQYLANRVAVVLERYISRMEAL